MLNHFLHVGMLVKITKPTGLKWYILAIVEFNKNSKNLYKLQSEEFGTLDHNKTDCMKTAMVHYDTIVISSYSAKETHNYTETYCFFIHHFFAKVSRYFMIFLFRKNH